MLLLSCEDSCCVRRLISVQTRKLNPHVSGNDRFLEYVRMIAFVAVT